MDGRDPPRRGRGGYEAYKDVPPRDARPRAAGSTVVSLAVPYLPRLFEEGAEPLVLEPSRARLVPLVAVSLAFVALGLVMRTPFWLLAAAFFGILAAMFAAMLLPGAGYLRLDAGGFTSASLFRPYRVAWTEVGGFRVVRLGSRELVGYDSTARSALRPRAARWAKRLGGHNSMLPDTYGLDAADLALLMNEARSLALLSRR